MKKLPSFSILQAMGLNPSNPLPGNAQALRLQVLGEASAFWMQAGAHPASPVLKPSSSRRPMNFRRQRAGIQQPATLLSRKNLNWVRGIQQQQDPQRLLRPKNHDSVVWNRRGQDVAGVISRRLEEEELRRRRSRGRRQELQPMRPNLLPVQPRFRISASIANQNTTQGFGFSSTVSSGQTPSPR